MIWFMNIKWAAGKNIPKKFETTMWTSFQSTQQCQKFFICMQGCFKLFFVQTVDL